MWFIFSILVALGQSGVNAFKKIGTQRTDPWTASWAQQLLALPILIPAAYLDFISFPVHPYFWLALLSTTLLNSATTVLSMYALRDTPLSLAVPMLTLSPLFLLFTSPLINHEYPTLLGCFGVSLIVVGIYSLGISAKMRSPLEPLQALLTHRGVRVMCLVAFLYSISSPLDKVGVQHSSPIFYACACRLSLLFVLSGAVLKYGKISDLRELDVLKGVAPIGLLSGVVGVMQMVAITMVPVVYVISIKRTSVVWSVLWGWLFFEEKRIALRLLGCLIALIGVVVVSLSH